MGSVRFGEDSAVVILKYGDDPRLLRVERSALGASPIMRFGKQRIRLPTLRQTKPQRPHRKYKSLTTLVKVDVAFK